LYTPRPGQSGVGRATLYGFVVGAAVGIILPFVFNLVGFLFHIVFTLGILAIVVLAAILLWKMVRNS